VTSVPPNAEWIKIKRVPDHSGSYPAFARFATEEIPGDVGIAPLSPSSFNDTKSDVKFLDYSAMGLLSVVSKGSAYQSCVKAGLAVGCDATSDAWFQALSQIIERRNDFADMRKRAAEHVWQNRNVLTDPEPLADLVI
jgi:hypothetical protein